MFHPWSRLPTELKFEVLQYALAQRGTIRYDDHLANLHVGQLSSCISTKNGEFVQLAVDAYYKASTFIITQDDIFCSPEHHYSLLRPKAQQAHKIQHLIFRIWHSLSTQLFLEQCTSIGMFELRKNDNQEITDLSYAKHDKVSARMAWQRDFTSLKCFTLSILFRTPPTPDSTCLCHYQDDLMENLAGATASIKAKSMRVKVQVGICRTKVCETRLAELFKGILEGRNNSMGA